MNLERVRDMTKLAIMEQTEGREIMKTCSYRRLDYILTEIFRAFIAGSVCYLLVLILWFCYLWDHLNAFVYDLDYMQFFRSLGMYYLLSVLLYMGICAVVAYFQYQKSMDCRKSYLRYLRRIRDSYKAESVPETPKKAARKRQSSRRH